MRSHQALKIAMVACISPTLECTATGHGLAGDLGVAMRDSPRGFLVQAQQHLRPLIAEIVDQTVVQAAIARTGIERDIGMSSARSASATRRCRKQPRWRRTARAARHPL